MLQTLQREHSAATASDPPPPFLPPSEQERITGWDSDMCTSFSVPGRLLSSLCQVRSWKTPARSPRFHFPFPVFHLQSGKQEMLRLEQTSGKSTVLRPVALCLHTGHSLGATLGSQGSRAHPETHSQRWKPLHRQPQQPRRRPVEPRWFHSGPLADTRISTPSSIRDHLEQRLTVRALFHKEGGSRSCQGTNPLSTCQVVLHQAKKAASQSTEGVFSCRLSRGVAPFPPSVSCRVQAPWVSPSDTKWTPDPHTAEPSQHQDQD